MPCPPPNPDAMYGHDGHEHGSAYFRRRKKRQMLVVKGAGLDAPRPVGMQAMRHTFVAAGLDVLRPVGMRATRRMFVTALRIAWASESPCGQPRPDALLSGAQDPPGTATNRPEGGLCIDPVLVAKARADPAYEEFVGAAASTLASPEAESLGMAGCSFAEKSDPERPSWLKLILHMDFAGGDFTSKRGRRIRLRELLGVRTGAARRESGFPGRIDEMAGRFFITVGWQHAI